MQYELLGLSGECGSLGCLGVFLEVRGGSVRVERKLDWGGVAYGVKWVVLGVLGRNGCVGVCGEEGSLLGV